VEVAGRVREFIRDEVLVDDGAVVRSDEAPLLNGALDSLGLMNLVSFLEEEFGIQVDDLELVPDNFETIARIEGYVTRKVQAQA
jgi:acyl carrier protein